MAQLTSAADWTMFSFGSDTIRFRTPSNLVRYTCVRKWDNGYLEVGADYGRGEEDEYIDLVPILENLYYDPVKFLKPIKGVEVRYG